MNNIENLKDIIENYSEELKYLPSSEIENLQALLEDIKYKPKSIWDLDIRDEKEYCRLNGTGDIEQRYFNGYFDSNARDIGNAFLTIEEANFERERRKIETVMRKYSRPFEYRKCNYYMVYDKRCNKIEFLENHYVYNGLSYFESEEIAQKVVDAIGEDRLRKYWFRVE